MGLRSLAKRGRKSLSGLLKGPEGDSTSDKCALYLHIGMPKTGTSAIQNFMLTNQSVLAKQGVCYPVSALHWSQHVPVVKAIVSSRFKDAQFNPLIPEIDLEKWVDELIAGCEVEGYTKVILSSEFFWAAPAMQLSSRYHEESHENFRCIAQVIEDCRSLFSWFDTVKIIIYLRRQGDWLESFFNQQIKNGFPLPPEEDLMRIKNYLLYYKNIQLWEKSFGAENIIVKGFEDVAGEVMNDFCRTVSIQIDDAFVITPDDPESANTRLTARATRIMRDAAAEEYDSDVMELFREVLQHTSAAIGEVRRDAMGNIFSDRFHRHIHRLYDEDNTRLAESYQDASSCLREPAERKSGRNIEESEQVIHEERVEMLLERVMSGKQDSVE